jgi:predicted dehydrogenase
MNIAIVGAGYIFEDLHLPVINRSTASLVYVAEVNSSTLEKVKSKLSTKTICVGDYKEIDLSKIEGVIVATPILSHYSICKYFLENGKNVLCEKPLAPTYEEALELKRIAEEKNVVLQVGFNRRFQASTAFIKDCIDKKRFGNLNQIIAKGGWILKGRIPLTLADRKISKGGITLDYGIHFIDRIYSWVNDIVPTLYKDDAQDGGVEINSIFNAGIVLKNQQFQPTFKMMLSWSSPLSNSIELHFDNAVVVNAINVSDSVQIFPTTDSVRSMYKPVESTVVRFEKEGDLSHNDLQLKEFINRSKNKEAESLSDLVQAIEATRVIEWCYNNKAELNLPFGL